MTEDTDHANRCVTAVSFEFFPPKTEAMEASLWEAIRKLEPLAPAFVSVTYGAGGSTRERTHATVSRILRQTALRPAAHLTCVAATKDEVNRVVRDYWESGVRHIVALRGDPPSGAGAPYVPHPGGYSNAADLAAGIKRIADFEVSVAAYPRSILSSRQLKPISTCWLQRSMLARRGQLPNSSSATITIGATWIAYAPAALTFP